MTQSLLLWTSSWRILTSILPPWKWTLNVLIATVWCLEMCHGQTTTLGFTGSVQSYAVVSTYTQVTACGAQGGKFTRASGFVISGGQGGCVTGILTVTPGTTLYVLVGGAGADAVRTTNPSILAGGWNGGGNGRTGGGGGGASDVRTAAGDVNSRLIVGAGGGGAGGDPSLNLVGGSGGGSNGGGGTNRAGIPAAGGSLTGGGSGGFCAAGTCPGIDVGSSGQLATGGTSGQGGGFDGGGGGGYFGGGGGAGSGSGGGGSSAVISGTFGSTQSGARAGNGYVSLTALAPSFAPSISPAPSVSPTISPTVMPSMNPTSPQPSKQPTSRPSLLPSSQPSNQPLDAPSSKPSTQPSRRPSGIPSRQPISNPSSSPSLQPYDQPSVSPSSRPTRQPTTHPSDQPSAMPSDSPTSQPSRLPSKQPFSHPSCKPSTIPSPQPSCQPSGIPTLCPTRGPSAQPSSLPTKSTIFPTPAPSSFTGFAVTNKSTFAAVISVYSLSFIVMTILAPYIWWVRRSKFSLGFSNKMDTSNPSTSTDLPTTSSEVQIDRTRLESQSLWSISFHIYFGSLRFVNFITLMINISSQYLLSIGDKAVDGIDFKAFAALVLLPILGQILSTTTAMHLIKKILMDDVAVAAGDKECKPDSPKKVPLSNYLLDFRYDLGKLYHTQVLWMTTFAFMTVNPEMIIFLPWFKTVFVTRSYGYPCFWVAETVLTVTLTNATLSIICVLLSYGLLITPAALSASWTVTLLASTLSWIYAAGQYLYLLYFEKSRVSSSDDVIIELLPRQKVDDKITPLETASSLPGRSEEVTDKTLGHSVAPMTHDNSPNENTIADNSVLRYIKSVILWMIGKRKLTAFEKWQLMYGEKERQSQSDPFAFLQSNSNAKTAIGPNLAEAQNIHGVDEMFERLGYDQGVINSSTNRLSVSSTGRSSDLGDDVMEEPLSFSVVFNSNDDIDFIGSAAVTPRIVVPSQINDSETVVNGSPAVVQFDPRAWFDRLKQSSLLGLYRSKSASSANCDRYQTDSQRFTGPTTTIKADVNNKKIIRTVEVVNPLLAIAKKRSLTAIRQTRRTSEAQFVINASHVTGVTEIQPSSKLERTDAETESHDFPKKHNPLKDSVPADTGISSTAATDTMRTFVTHINPLVPARTTTNASRLVIISNRRHKSSDKIKADLDL